MKELDPHDRPREKLARVGVGALGDNELVAVLLGSGLPDRGALMLANDILRVAGGLNGLPRLGLDELTRVAGVGESRAARVLVAVELGRRALGADTMSRPQLLTSQAIAEYLSPLFAGHRVERFGLLLLDAKCRVIRTTILSVGSADTSFVHPREVFREATLASATAIVLFHNHPSGDPDPSDEDRLLTLRMLRAGQIMGIRVVDHVILGDGCWFSFAETFRLTREEHGENPLL